MVRRPRDRNMDRRNLIRTPNYGDSYYTKRESGRCGRGWGFPLPDSIVPGGWGDGGLYLQGEEAAGIDTETSTMMAEVSLPPEYVAAAAASLVVHAKYTKDANCDTFTIDCEAYELDDEGVATEIRAAGSEALATSFADHTFALTTTNLLPGDKILLLVRTIITNVNAPDASRSFIGSTELQLTTKAA